MAMSFRRMSSRKTQSARDAAKSVDSSKTCETLGHLRPLNKSPTTKAIFIVVPGFDEITPEHPHALEGTCDSWLCSSELHPAGDVSVFVYEHSLPSDLTPSWESVSRQGARLLEELEGLQFNPAVGTALHRALQAIFAITLSYVGCPMVFISHGVGGFLLKRAICLAHSRQEHIRGHIAAAVLISCLHSKDESSKAWTDTLPRMYKSSQRLRRPVPPHSEMAKSLADDCYIFEQAFQHYPVATVYETGEVRNSRFPWTQKVLVHRELARTSVPGEKLWGVDLDHHSTGRIGTRTDVRRSIATFLLSSLAKTRAALHDQEIRREDLKFIPSTYSVTNRSRRLSATNMSFSSRTSQDQRERNHVAAIVNYDDSAPLSTGPYSPLSTGPPHDAGHTPSMGGSELPSLIPAFATGRITDPKFPYFVVPRNRNEIFFGRVPTLKEMKRVLCFKRGSGQDKSITFFALTGQAGIGKTQVAVEFVHGHRDFFDAIFWVRAHDIERLHQSFQEIAIKLGLVERLSTDSFDRSLTRRLVLEWLKHPPKRSGENGDNEPIWLMVFDNVDNSEILQEFLPQNASGRVLITSKDPLAGSPFYINKEGIKLTEFDREETSQFLIRLTGRQNDEDDKQMSLKFAARLGGIPLAIVLMAGVITRKNITFAEFLTDYKKGHSHAELFDTRLSTHYGQGFERTIASAYGLDNLVSGRDLLDVLSFFDPDGIPEYIFIDNCAQIAMDLSDQAARTELFKSSLITRNRIAKQLTIHRLTQDNARSKMSQDRYDKVFTSVLHLLAEVWPYGEEFGFLGYESYKWSKANELYIHILHIRKFSNVVRPPVKFTPEHFQPLKVLLEAAWFGVMRGDFKDTKALLDLAATFLKPLEDDIEGQRDQPKAVIEKFKEQRRLYHFYRGSRALHTNEPKESLSEFETFWTMLRDEVIKEPCGEDRYMGSPWNETYESMLGDDLEETPRGEYQYLGVAWNELGNAYLQNDYTTKAEACFRKSFSIMNVKDGPITPNTVSMPLINLGYALWLQSKLPEAASVFEDALKYREENYGSQDTISFATGKLFLGYGNVKKDQGDLDASFQCHRKCLELYLKSLGKYHHRIGDGSVRLSDHYVRMGKFAEAKHLLDRACDIYGSRDHFRPEQARAKFKRASVLRQMQQFEEAKRDAQHALELFHQVTPDDKRGPEQLTIKDYDRPIMFWSK